MLGAKRKKKKTWLIYCQKIENHQCQEGFSPERTHLTHLQNKRFSFVRCKWFQLVVNLWSPMAAAIATPRPPLWHDCLPGTSASRWHLPALHTAQLPGSEAECAGHLGLTLDRARELRLFSQRRIPAESSSPSTTYSFWLLLIHLSRLPPSSPLRVQLVPAKIIRVLGST